MNKINRASYVCASNKPWSQNFQHILNDVAHDQIVWVSSRDELATALANIQPRYIFFLHWSWIVPKFIYENYECVCFHMTDVPYGRGGSPLQNLIIRGHKTTKLTALKMVEEMDAGPVYIKKDMSLLGKAEDIYLQATKLSFELINWMINNEPIPQPQEGAVVSFSRRTPEQSELPQYFENIEKLYDFIRMLDAPTYPKAFIKHGNMIIEFLDAQLIDNKLSASVNIVLDSKKSE